MAGCLKGDKPLSEPMMTHFIDTYMHHSAYNRNNRKRLHLWNIEIQCTKFNYYIQFILNPYIMRLKIIVILSLILLSSNVYVHQLMKLCSAKRSTITVIYVWLQDPVHLLSSSTGHNMHPCGTCDEIDLPTGKSHKVFFLKIRQLKHLCMSDPVSMTHVWVRSLIAILNLI